MSSMYRGSRLRSTLNTSYIRFGHVSSMYRGSRLRSTSYRPRKNAKTLPRFSGRRQKHAQQNRDFSDPTHKNSWLFNAFHLKKYMLTLKSYRFLVGSAAFCWREVAIAASKPPVNGIHEETWITWMITGML